MSSPIRFSSPSQVRRANSGRIFSTSELSPVRESKQVQSIRRRERNVFGMIRDICAQKRYFTGLFKIYRLFSLIVLVRGRVNPDHGIKLVSKCIISAITGNSDD